MLIAVAVVQTGAIKQLSFKRYDKNESGQLILCHNTSHKLKSNDDSMTFIH